jgi:preprotein translocase subunit SecG
MYISLDVMKRVMLIVLFTFAVICLGLLVIYDISRTQDLCV